MANDETYSFPKLKKNWVLSKGTSYNQEEISMQVTLNVPILLPAGELFETPFSNLW
jgi:hypothetical protein